MSFYNHFGQPSYFPGHQPGSYPYSSSAVTATPSISSPGYGSENASSYPSTRSASHWHTHGIGHMNPGMVNVGHPGTSQSQPRGVSFMSALDANIAIAKASTKTEPDPAPQKPSPYIHQVNYVTIDINSEFTAPKSLAGRKFACTDTAHFTTATNAFNSCMSGTHNTQQADHHVTFDLASYAGTQMNPPISDLGTLIAHAITPELLHQGAAKLINTQLNENPALKIIDNTTPTPPKPSSATNDPDATETDTDADTDSTKMNLNDILRADEEAQASAAAESGAGSGGGKKSGAEGRGEEKTQAEIEAEQKNQKKQQKTKQKSEKTPQDTPGYSTNRQREIVIASILSGKRSVTYTGRGAESIPHGTEIAKEIGNFHEAMIRIYTGEHFDTATYSTAPVHATQDTIHGYMQNYLRGAHDVWTKAKTQSIEQQIQLQFAYGNLSNCPILNYLGVRESIKTAGIEVQAVVNSMFDGNWTKDASLVIDEARCADKYSEDLVSFGLNVAPKNFNLFTKLREAIIGTSSRENTKNMIENLKKMVIAPDETCVAFYRRIKNEHNLIFEQESFLTLTDRFYRDSIESGLIQPSNIVLEGCRTAASRCPKDHSTLVFHGEHRLREYAKMRGLYDQEHIHNLSMNCVQNICYEIDRESAPTRSSHMNMSHKKKPRSESTHWSQLAQTNGDDSSDNHSSDEHEHSANLYTGQHGACPYCGGNDDGHDVTTCARKAFDKSKSQLGANAQQSYLDHQKQLGREHILTQSGARTIPFPSNLDDFYVDRDKYLNLLRTGHPNTSSSTSQRNSNNKTRGEKSTQNGDTQNGTTQNGTVQNEKIVTDLKAFMTSLLKQTKVKKRGAGGRTRKHKHRQHIDWSETDESESDSDTESEEENDTEPYEESKKGKHKNKS